MAVVTVDYLLGVLTTPYNPSATLASLTAALPPRLFEGPVTFRDSEGGAPLDPAGAATLASKGVKPGAKLFYHPAKSQKHRALLRWLGAGVRAKLCAAPPASSDAALRFPPRRLAVSARSGVFFAAWGSGEQLARGGKGGSLRGFVFPPFSSFSRPFFFPSLSRPQTST